MCFTYIKIHNKLKKVFEKHRKIKENINNKRFPVRDISVNFRLHFLPTTYSTGLIIGGLMSYLCCLFEYSGVQHILCFVCLHLVYPMLPVSLDCPFLIATSVFSNIYL